MFSDLSKIKFGDSIFIVESHYAIVETYLKRAGHSILTTVKKKHF